MGLSLDGADPNLSLNGARPNLSLNGADPRAPAGPNAPPRPTISVSPDRALSTVDLGQQGASGARFTWNPGTGATSVRVTLPDGVITDLSRRSHIVRSFDLEQGHYRDSVGTIVSTNAAGDSDPVEAALFRYRPVAMRFQTRQLGDAFQPGGNVFTRVALDLWISGRPFPQVITIAPSGHQGAPTSHQMVRWFSYEASDANFERSRTGDHAIVMERDHTIVETVTYVVTATQYWGGTRHPDGVNWIGGTQLSNRVLRVPVTW